MAYATVADVQQLNTGRTFGASTKPTASQVMDYLEQTAAVLDGILRGQGYTVPVPTTATAALKTLELYNAQGAACLVEQGAPSTKPDRDGVSACAMWAQACKMLKSGAIELEIPRDAAEANPRYNACATPFFSRTLDH